MKMEESMRLNTVKRKLKDGEFVFGTMVKEELALGIVDVLELAGYRLSHTDAHTAVFLDTSTFLLVVASVAHLKRLCPVGRQDRSY